MKTEQLIRTAMQTLQTEYSEAGVMMAVTIAARLAWGEEISPKVAKAWKRLETQIEVWGHKETFAKTLAMVI